MCSVLDLSHGEMPGCGDNIPKVCPGPAQALCRPVVGAELSLWARASEAKAVASLLRAHIPTPPRRGACPPDALLGQDTASSRSPSSAERAGHHRGPRTQRSEETRLKGRGHGRRTCLLRGIASLTQTDGLARQLETPPGYNATPPSGRTADRCTQLLSHDSGTFQGKPLSEDENRLPQTDRLASIQTLHFLLVLGGA